MLNVVESQVEFVCENCRTSRMDGWRSSFINVEMRIQEKFWRPSCVTNAKLESLSMRFDIYKLCFFFNGKKKPSDKMFDIST